MRGHRLSARSPGSLRRIMAVISSGLVLGSALSALPPPTRALAAQSTKLVVIPLENKTYDDIINNPQAPYINHLIAHAPPSTRYTAVADSSNPHHLPTTSG